MEAGEIIQTVQPPDAGLSSEAATSRYHAAHSDLLARAEKCRSLAKWVTDKKAQDVLIEMARECESQAAALRID